MDNILSYIIPSGSVLLIIATVLKICQFCTGLRPILDSLLDCFCHDSEPNTTEQVISTVNSTVRTNINPTLTPVQPPVHSSSTPLSSFKKVNSPELPSGSVTELHMV